MPFLLLSILGAAIITVFYLLSCFLNLPHDAKEPLLITPKIPFIGHVIGLLRDGTGYYSKIAKECNEPIFTLSLPRAKMYIVTSPSLVTTCDRRAKVVSFAPYVVGFARRILAASQRGIHLLSEDLLEENGPVSLRPETMKCMHQSLMPGKLLEQTIQAVSKNVSDHLDSGVGIGDQTSVPLFQWIRQFVSIASTNVIYGPEKNPMRDPGVMGGFWAVDRGFALLGLMVFPGLTAPEASRGRKRFFDAFRKYYAAGGLNTASQLVKARHEVNSKHGVSDEDIAHFDLGLSELRRGIESVVFRQKKTLKDSVTTVNIPRIIKGFPLLESLVKEVLRVQSNSTSARFLLKDTFIDDGNGATYLLKKDSFLAMPSALLHNSEAVWGPTFQTFDPARFLKQQDQRVPASSYRTFGGGSALCPGRHFAMYEILSILIIMVLRYDVKPLEGKWKIPETKHHISTSILTPVEDIQVRIQPREGVDSIRWNFVWEPEMA